MQKYYYVKRTNNFQRKKNPFTVFLYFIALLLLFGGSVVFLLRLNTKREKKEVLAAKTATLPTPTPTITPTPLPNNSSLKEVIDKELEGTKASYSIVINNFKTGQTYYLDEHKRYETASLYKLWVMAKVYELIRDNTLKESDILAGNVETLNKKFQIASEAAELKEGKLSMTISDALYRMITFSDNYSALLLTQKIKLSTILPYLEENEFTETLISPKNPSPYTTASDVAKFFEMLYKGDLANAEYTNKMIALLKDQTLNKKLPRFLPQDTAIAHKTGELDSYSHDAGIVYSPKGDYLIVVMSKSTEPNLANNRIANISEAVYKFFNSQ